MRKKIFDHDFPDWTTFFPTVKTATLYLVPIKSYPKKMPTRLLCSKGEGEYYEEEMPRLLTKKRSIAEPFFKKPKILE